MKRTFFLILVSCFCISAFAESTENDYRVDSIFVTNFLRLQKEILNTKHNRFGQPLNDVTLIREKDLVMFLQVINYLSGIKYCFGWAGTGITEKQLKEMVRWYYLNRSSLTNQIINEAYNLNN